MSHILEVQQRISPLLRDYHSIFDRFSPPGVSSVAEWMSFAFVYSRAASALSDPSKSHELPRAQLAGHAIECALKAFLTSKSVPFPTGSKGHDLITLAVLAENHGCLFTELQAVAVVQISSLFFENLGSNERYTSRYPTGRGTLPKSFVGYFHGVDDLVQSLASQISA